MAAAAGDQATLPEPITREEMFLAKAAGMNAPDLVPVTRAEMYLAKISGGGSGGSGGSSEEWIGDGNTHIWITLHEGRTSPMLGVCPNGTVTVDWGDGTTPDVLTGTSVYTVQWTPNHDYAKSGDYVITLTVDGEMGLYGEQAMYKKSTILRCSSVEDGRNAVYQTAVKRVEIGDDVKIIGSYAFANCCALTSITMPNGVKSIINSAFSGCYSMRYFDFTSCTAVPTAFNTGAFTGLPSDCEFRVPAALYDEWIAATNWTKYASQIVAV